MNKQVGKWMVFCVALAAVVLGLKGAAFAVSAAEREALIALYEATGGDNWDDNSGWLGDVGTECEWFGVTCELDRVVGIDMGRSWNDGNNLVGSVPPEIGNLVNLTSLYLSDNQLTSLPAEIGSLANLTNLYLDDNQLTSLPAEIGSLANLTDLSLDDNQLTSLPAEIGNLANLTELILYDNQLTSLPPEIGNLTNLTELDIFGNQLKSLPPEIGNLDNLTKLNIEWSQLTSLPPEIGNLDNLTKLILYGNQLASLPPEIGNLANLTKLNIFGNELTSLPAEIWTLTNLTNLYLDENQLTSLPPEIGNLANLTKLYISSNQLTSLPPEIGNLANLTELDISSNQLTSLPPEIGNLANLTKLYISSNQLTSLPPEIWNLSNLTTLGMSGNQLTSLPPEIWNLSNLTILGMNGNQLTSLPAEIGNLANLTNLDIRSNQLTSLPAQLWTLSNLAKLYISGNPLTSLPAEIGNLVNLTTLWLEENQLTTLPAEFTSLSNLYDLDICDNSLQITNPDLVAFLNKNAFGWETCQRVAPGNHLPAIEIDDWGAMDYATPDYNALELWVKIIDHDGIDGPNGSHTVKAIAPDGEEFELNFYTSYGPNAAGYEGFYTERNPIPGDYAFTVTDPDGNTATVVDTLEVDPLLPPAKESITPSLQNPVAERVTAEFDNVRVNGELYDNFDDYAAIDNIDEAKWWRGNCPTAEIQDGKLVISQENMLGGGSCYAMGLSNPTAASAIQADITVTDASSGLGRGRISGTFYNDGAGDMYAAINVTTDRVYYYVGRNDETNQPHAPWITAANGDIIQIAPGETVSASISWDGATMTFAANGETASFTPEGTVASPNGPSIGLSTRISLSVPDTSPTFSWAPVEGALEYRIRIYNYNRSETIWRGYTGETSYQIPPGILTFDPTKYTDATYYARIDARDAHSNFDIDNLSRQPANNADFEFFPTAIATTPLIETGSSSLVKTRTDDIIGLYLQPWIKVHDAQGVPGNIRSVKIISPSGKEAPLYHNPAHGDNTATCGVYTNAMFADFIESGVYTLVVEDLEGHQHSVEDEVIVNSLPLPDVRTSLPAQDAVLDTTAVDFDWSDVAGAVFYELQILNRDFSTAYKFHTTESAYSLPAGFLKPESLYRYRVTAYDKFYEENYDNNSVLVNGLSRAPTFFTGAQTGGTAQPVIDLKGFGAWVFRTNVPGTDAPLYGLMFDLTVQDGDGVPGNIASVTVTGPDRAIHSLICGDAVDETESYYSGQYFYSSLDDIAEGVYTITVTDFDGNSATMEDALTMNEIPQATDLTPVKESIVSSVTPVIDWSDVPGAAVYRVRVYDGWGETLHKSDFMENSVYTIPSGILETGNTYSYRVEAYREAAPDEDIDNASISHIYYGNRVHFTVGSPGDNQPPAAPQPSAPTDEAIDADGTVTLQTANFSDPDGDVHLSTHWTLGRADMPYNAESNSFGLDETTMGEHLTEYTVEGLPAGLKYVWKAAFLDGYGDASPESQEIAFKVGTSTMDSVSTPPGEVAADFRMVSFVQWPDNPTESAVMGDDMGGTYDTTLYRIGTYDPMINGYVEYGKGMKMEPGRAYWVFARHGLDISVNGVPVTLDHAVEVPLDYNAETLDGWNMIAPPNDRLYDWGDVEIVVYDGNGGILYGPIAISEMNDANPYIDKRLWSWENGAYNPDAQDLFSRHGYWVRAFRENVSLRFPARSVSVEASPAIRLARSIKKAAQWISNLMPEPRTAIADANDSPPAPIGGFTGEPTSGASDSKSGDSGCFISTAHK